MKRTFLLLIPLLLLNLIFSQNVEIKDSDDEALMIINDEGTDKSSLTIPSSGTAPTEPSNKLYNQGGTLKWSGVTLNTSGGDNLGNHHATMDLDMNNHQIKSSGNIGIGTSTPTVSTDKGLEIVGFSPALRLNSYFAPYYTYDIITTYNDPDGPGGVDPVYYFTIKDISSDSDRLVILENGNMGIGITNPLSKLSVGGDGYANVRIFGQKDGSSGWGVYGKATGQYGRGICGEAIYIGPQESYGGHFTAASYYGRGVYGEASSTESVINYGGYFIANGNSGYGVYGKSNGNAGLGVYGDVIGNNAYGIYGRASGNNGRAVHGYATNSGEVTNYGGNFVANGAFGRGVYGKATRTGSYENYGGYFEAAGTSGRGVYGYASAGMGVYNYGGYFKANGDYGTGVYGFGNEYDFYADGPGTNYGASSSIRWKNNIIEIDNPLAKLSELRGVYFNWDEEHGGHHDIGCIAEEVGKVLPEIVVYEENGIDADGMDYSKLTPLLVEAVKAQQKIIDDLTKRIEYLESN